ncbi:hypothetical protein EVAR_62831_1 [Eumeta japonica]|uniref:Uncharacterized protein n=1 Tax=Eumeta variegata TaxID=151549 RepID=A0A4C2A5M2_EUMVA|nr:hypothetical protein EVAR_62831_1 [Eumeta japonica]
MLRRLCKLLGSGKPNVKRLMRSSGKRQRRRQVRAPSRPLLVYMVMADGAATLRSTTKDFSLCNVHSYTLDDRAGAGCVCNSDVDYITYRLLSVQCGSGIEPNNFNVRVVGDARRRLWSGPRTERSVWSSSGIAAKREVQPHSRNGQEQKMKSLMRLRLGVGNGPDPEPRPSVCGRVGDGGASRGRLLSFWAVLSRASPGHPQADAGAEVYPSSTRGYFADEVLTISRGTHNNQRSGRAPAPAHIGWSEIVFQRPRRPQFHGARAPAALALAPSRRRSGRAKALRGR